MFRFLGKILGWVILSVIGIIALISGVIFFGYIILWILGILVGISLFGGLVYLLLKLFGK